MANSERDIWAAPLSGAILCDWRANAGRGGIQCLLALFRLSQQLRRRRRPIGWIGRIVGRLYTAVAHIGYGIDLPLQTAVGPGLVIHHGVGLVVNARTRIGCGVTLRHNTTLGSRHGDDDCPTLESGVDVGPHCVILGAITLAEGARIGAGSVVLTDVPAHATAVGNPARVIGHPLESPISS
jgi:serine acetyltransferase